MTQDETIKLQETIKEKILAEAKEGNVVIISVDGLMVGKTQEIIKQSIETLLYDLNRDEMTILTFLPDIKWINDFAVSQVIRALKKRVEELENELKSKLIK